MVRSCTYGTVSASRKLNNSDKQNKMNYFFSKPRTSISYDDCTIINKKVAKMPKDMSQSIIENAKAKCPKGYNRFEALSKKWG